MPSVKVGGDPCQVSWTEYFGAICPKGTPVEFTVVSPRAFARPERALSGVGVFSHSWFYDGVNIEIDCQGKTVSLMPSIEKVRIRRLRDLSRMVGEGCSGDGI